MSAKKNGKGPSGPGTGGPGGPGGSLPQPPPTMGGYNGKILRVNLSKNKM